jgi:hypothetical protein
MTRVDRGVRHHCEKMMLKTIDLLIFSWVGYFSNGMQKANETENFFVKQLEIIWGNIGRFGFRWFQMVLVLFHHYLWRCSLTNFEAVRPILVKWIKFSAEVRCGGLNHIFLSKRKRFSRRVIN